MLSKSKWHWNVDRSDQRKTKNSQQQKSKAANCNTSKLVNTTNCKVFQCINSNGKESKKLKKTNNISNKPTEKTSRMISDGLKQTPVSGFKLNIIKWSANIVKPVGEQPQRFSAPSRDVETFTPLNPLKLYLAMLFALIKKAIGVNINSLR